MEAWYADLEKLKQVLVERDPRLQPVFTTVDASGFALHTVIKSPYPALIGAIIGQKVRYTQARQERARLYSQYGTDFTPTQLSDQDFAWLGGFRAQAIVNVTEHILTYAPDLSTEDGIRSLTIVPGIGLWTIETTLLTCLMSWDIFPMGDKFLQTRMRRLYGPSVNIKAVTAQWAPYRSVVTWYLWRWF